jgi:hypothetical protein
VIDPLGSLDDVVYWAEKAIAVIQIVSIHPHAKAIIGANVVVRYGSGSRPSIALLKDVANLKLHPSLEFAGLHLSER